jgi:hypothetical protein
MKEAYIPYTVNGLSTFKGQPCVFITLAKYAHLAAATLATMHPDSAIVLFSEVL